MKAPQTRDGREGFTLIEMMIAVAVIGLIMVWLVPALHQAQKASGSEVALQQAVRALQNETELIKVMPYDDLKVGSRPFDARNRALAQVPGAQGEVKVDDDPALPELRHIQVTLKFQDPRWGERSIHTELLRAP